MLDGVPEANHVRGRAELVIREVALMNREPQSVGGIVDGIR